MLPGSGTGSLADLQSNTAQLEAGQKLAYNPTRAFHPLLRRPLTVSAGICNHRVITSQHQLAESQCSISLLLAAYITILNGRGPRIEGAASHAPAGDAHCPVVHVLKHLAALGAKHLLSNG